MHQVTTGEILAASIEVGFHTSFKFDEEMYRRISCPVLVVHGRLDTIIRVEAAEKIAELTGAELEIWEDAAHAPNGRHPARFNLLMEDFFAKALWPHQSDIQRATSKQIRQTANQSTQESTLSVIMTLLHKSALSGIHCLNPA